MTAVATRTATETLRLFDPTDVDLDEGIQRFRTDPLDPAQRALYDRYDGINGHPLDWTLTLDPDLDQALIAVRARGDIAHTAWFHRDGRYRDETFASPFSGRDWDPDIRLVRRLLVHTPYVIALPTDDGIRYAFDLRTIDAPKELARLLSGRQEVMAASGAPWTLDGRMDAIVCQVPFSGDRFARSTRKRFRLAVPGADADATVEGLAARILRANGFFVETPHLITALYRLLITEPVAYWFRDPLRIEERGALSHHPPGLNPLEALARGRDAVRRVALGDAPFALTRLGTMLVDTGKRPPTYHRYIDRLRRCAEALGPTALAGLLEGMLIGHRTTRADLLAAHNGTGQAFLVEVKSRGDRLRNTQMAAALWHQRDGRCGYRLMRIDHPKVA